MMRSPEEQQIIDRYVMRPKWTIMSKRADFAEIGRKFGIDPVVARVITNRGICGDDNINMYLNGGADLLHDPGLMKDLPEGCRIVMDKLENGSRIRIISDYDVDGVTSNYILLLGLRKVWAQIHGARPEECEIVDYDIPHRIHDGYGIKNRLIDAAKADGVDTIITCDNGIAAFEQIKYAKTIGMTVIVTDHHQVPYQENGDGTKTYTLPPADAVIDNQRVDCQYPFKGLCGAGVACKFIQYLYRLCGIDEREIQEFFEVLGLATNCDMMDLVDENRIFVKYALESLKDSRNPGLNALMRLSGKNEKKITTYDLGFLIGPCINAAGRLGDARTSLEFLLEKNAAKAETKAAELIQINNDRKSMTENGVKLITKMLEDATIAGKIGDTATLADRVIVAYIPDVHESVVGIIASKLKEAYSRPVMIFTDSEHAGILKGSGRFIESYNMYEHLSRVKSYFREFGGHAMAAGFSIESSRLGELRRVLNEQCALTDEDITPKVRIDVGMPLQYLARQSMRITEQLYLLEPYGKGNRKALFGQANVPVRKASILGKNRNLLKLVLDIGENQYMEAIYFDPDEFVNNIKQWFGADECDKMLNGRPNKVVIDMVYYPEINEFRNTRNVQIRLERYDKCD